MRMRQVRVKIESDTMCLQPLWEENTMQIKKICFSPKVSIQPCRPKSDSAPSGAIWAQFRPKTLNQKAIPAHAYAHFIPRVQISPR